MLFFFRKRLGRGMRYIMSHFLFSTGHILWVGVGGGIELGAREVLTLRKCAWKAVKLCSFRIQCHPWEELLWVGAIGTWPVFRNSYISLTQVTQSLFSLFYIFSFQLRLRWLAGLYKRKQYKCSSIAPACSDTFTNNSWWLASLGATVTASIISFSIVVVCRTPWFWSFYTNFILVVWDYWGFRMWRKILGRKLHEGRVVFCTSISGACIRICSTNFLLTEVEMWFLMLRHLSLTDATFSSLWFRVSADRCSWPRVRLIGWL